ncbi:hypothetical protein ACFLTH_16760 [Bacteroidota bacterium]
MKKELEKIVDALGSAISQKNKYMVEKSLRDFILTYLPNPSKSKYYNSDKDMLNTQFGLNDNINSKSEISKNNVTDNKFRLNFKKIREEKIKNLVEAYNKKEKSYSFKFIAGSGMNQLQFDFVNNTVMYPAGEYPNIETRFVELYGSHTVKLNIK